MLKYFISAIFYLFYGGLVYTAFVPEHAYLTQLDDFRTVYIWIHVPVAIVMSFFALIMSFSNHLVLEVKNGVGKTEELPEKAVQQMELALQELDTKKPFVIFNRIVTNVTTFVVLFFLQDMILGFLMLFSTALFYVIIGQLKDFVKGVKECLQSQLNTQYTESE